MTRNLLVFLALAILPLISFSKGVIPPGTAKINDSLYIDKTELRNVDYKEYVYWLKNFIGADSEQYKAALPDTTVWKNIYKAFDTPYVSLYYQHPAYNEYPLVGISYEQAVAYCEWRTARVNEYLYAKENKLKYGTSFDTINVPQVFRYRLPTLEEWESVASINYSKRTWRMLNREKNKYLSRHNLKGDVIEDPNSDHAQITAPVSFYWPNALGVYNMIGNVAEMTDENGLAKGGSWMHTYDESQVTLNQTYKKPEVWLGFRCVCDVVKQ